ncbi:uncharacterized protein G2W53_015650 [Senna tora]|uniref:Uncharacterized protein n=1 Tax=Senna tora TaxID=362788 RepID=A0A834WVX6_9FABA|nr:uncharacterized protein G2W53_015650 [Senna tora]
MASGKVANMGLGQDLFKEDQKVVEAVKQDLLFEDIEQVTQGMDYIQAGTVTPVLSPVADDVDIAGVGWKYAERRNRINGDGRRCLTRRRVGNGSVDKNRNLMELNMGPTYS